MLWIWLAAAVVGLWIVAWWSGQRLPADYSVSRSVPINRTAEEIWSLLAHVADYPRWRSDLRAVHIVSPEVWRETWSNGNQVKVRLRESAVPAMRVTSIDDPTLPFSSTWTYTLTPEGAGTRLRIEEAGEIRHPMFRLLARYAFGYSRALETVLRDAARNFGAGAGIQAP